MENTTKLLLNHAFCHLMIIPAVIYGEWWMWLAAFLWWQVVAVVAISGGYHRYYSHKTFKTRSWYQYAVNFLGIFSGAGPVLAWVGAHRMHHAHSDTTADPHSAKYKGFWTIYLNKWGYDVNIERKYLKGVLGDKVLRWFYNNYFKLNVTIILVLFAIDPLLMVFGYAITVVFAFHGYSLLNTLGHRNGIPRNTIIGNILTAGEGWHANHHEDGKDYRIGRKWWQWDPTALFIRLIKENG